MFPGFITCAQEPKPLNAEVYYNQVDKSQTGNKSANYQDVFFKAFDFIETAEHYSSGRWSVTEEEGGYVITGYSYKGTNQCYMYIIKTGYTGDTLWTKEYKIDDPVNPYEFICFDADGYGNQVYFTEDSAYKLDSDWNLTTLMLSGKLEFPRFVTILPDGNYLFGDMFLSQQNATKMVKINSQTLDVMWTSTPLFYNTPGSGGAWIRGVVEMPDGEIIVNSAHFYSVWGGPEYYKSTFYRLSSQGVVLDTTDRDKIYYYGTVVDNGNLESVTNNYNVSQYHGYSLHAADGEILHTFTFSYKYKAQRAIKDEGKLIVLRAFSENDKFALECYEDENLVWSAEHPITTPQWEGLRPLELIATEDGGYLVYGEIFDSDEFIYPFLLKTDYLGRSAPVGIVEEKERRFFNLYPNPAYDNLTISGNGTIPMNESAEICIYNTCGKLVFTTHANKLPKTVSISMLPKGLYLMKLSMSEGAGMAKFIKN